MIFDTDIFIWVEKGNEKASRIVDQADERFMSVQTYMELFQCARNKAQHKNVKDFLSSYDFIVLPFTENIGHRASIYIEEYTLSTGLRAGDAVIAATATENNMELVSSNAKHFKPIKELKLRSFKP
ncbi:MAG: type II toxin-antitoxin system VapC family toxin [Candidatus Scalindua sp.]